jgi:hypothetical protein
MGWPLLIVWFKKASWQITVSAGNLKFRQRIDSKKMASGQRGKNYKYHAGKYHKVAFCVK